jgi:threonine dehydratase
MGTPAGPHRLSLDRIREAARTIDPVFLHTPQYVCEPLGDSLGVRVLLKVEILNPIRSFKGRGASYFISGFGGPGPVVCASAGNFGQAMAYACRGRRIPITIYAAASANPLKVERMRALGANVVLHGDDFDAAKLEARRGAGETGGQFVEDGLEPRIAEGAGTIALELLASRENFDAILVPVGNGALIAGLGRVLKAERPGVRIIAVQAAGAPAMVESWRAGTLVTHDRVDTIADGIAVRIPIREAVGDMRAVVDEAILVQEESIRLAMRLIHEHAGVVVEPSGAVGVAAILERAETFRNLTAATVLCGGNLTAEQIYRWL